MGGYRICRRCVMDTTDPEIEFNGDGTCNHCLYVDSLSKMEPFCLNPEELWQRLEGLVQEIKSDGKGKRYDCIVGVSGGVDSTFVAYNVKKWGLRPLAVSLINGWETGIALKNVENLSRKLNIDLRTYTVDWNEFRDLQVSFLKASTPDGEIPTDHAIKALLYEIADKENVRFIVAGTNTATESILPQSWSRGHDDWKYIKSIQKRFGTAKLKSFPHYSRARLIYHRRLRRIKWISVLDYLHYVREDAKRILSEEIGWMDYGRKHLESLYTKFHMSYILPTKFGFDKRRAHLSSLILAGQMTREQALDELKKPLYMPEELREEREYVIRKLALTPEEFDEIMASPPKTFWDYPSYESSRFYNLLRKVLSMRNRDT